jgi:dipeptidyl aminopeptidase/acylaminoacyl peptidase
MHGIRQGHKLMASCVSGLRPYLLSMIGALVLLPSVGNSALPPLVDRNLFFVEPEISGMQISPDGKYLSFLKPVDGVRNIWVKRTDEPFDKARPITANSKDPTLNYRWTPDAMYILFMQDAGGDENFNIYAVKPDEPLARDLTHTKGVSSQIYAMPRKTPDTIYIGMNDRDKAWPDLYAVQLSTGKRTLVRTNDLRGSGWVFDLDGKLRLAMRAAENGDREVLRLDAKGFTKIYSCTVFESCAVLQFHEDGKRFYMTSNRGPSVDLTRLVLVDVEGGREEHVETDPENRVDLGSAVFAAQTGELVAAVYPDDNGSRWVWRDSSYKADFALLHSKLPNRELTFTTTSDEKLWLVQAIADNEPGETYLFDRRTKQLTFQYRILGALPRAALSNTVPITYLSSDGLRIPAYLTLPKGVKPERLPLIVMAHGGPWARDHWGYMSHAQFLANRGIAVLQPNYRGSTGYGKKFLNAGNKEWGEKIQDDLTWGVRHLVEQGVADPKRVGIFGGSFGGYCALAGIAFTPDTYAAAASWVGPSNLPMVLDSLSGFAEGARKMFHERIGNPNTAEGRAQLERQSPFHSLDRIRTPLLVIHGANDPRVRQADFDQLVVALHERGIPIEYLLFPDEGHVLGVGKGFAHPVNDRAIFSALEKFFAQYLGTRYQTSLEPEVAQRLKETAVDPARVVVGKDST